MGDSYPNVRLAAVQAAPVWLDRDATVNKACRLIEEAADNGAKVIGFPEGFIPGFPDWYHWHMPRSPQSVTFSKGPFKNAIEVPGVSVDALAAAARRAHAFIVVGVNASLRCSR
jgi:nitrilase